MLVAHLRSDHKVDMHDGCSFNHRYVKSNPHEVENATWMLTVRTFFLFFSSYFLQCQKCTNQIPVLKFQLL